MGKILTDAVVIEIGTGLLVRAGDREKWASRPESTFYMVELPRGLDSRRWALRQWEGMSREDRSTQARINGQEVKL